MVEKTSAEPRFQVDEADEKKIIRLLEEWREDGNKQAFKDAFELVHVEISRLAHLLVRKETRSDPSGTISLVNELFLKWVNGKPQLAKNKKELLTFARRALKNLQFDSVRKKRQSCNLLALDDLAGLGEPEPAMAETVEANLMTKLALAALEAKYPEKATVFTLSIAGNEQLEIADALDISIATVTRHYRFAKAFLAKHLDKSNH